MPGRIDYDELLARNPHIDPKQVEKANELYRGLRDMGVQRKGYDLAPPYGGRRVAAHGDDRADTPPLRSRRSRSGK